MQCFGRGTAMPQKKKSVMGLVCIHSLVQPLQKYATYPVPSKTWLCDSGPFGMSVSHFFFANCHHTNICGLIVALILTQSASLQMIHCLAYMLCLCWHAFF